MSHPPSKRRRTELTLADKVKLIKDSESTNLTRQQLGQKYGIGKTTATDIIRKKADYLRQFEENVDSSRQRFKTSSKFEEINDLVWTWFQQARAKNIPISGPMLQEKALSFASSLGVDDFKASNGWLESWKSRHAVKGFKVSGESADVDPSVVEDFKSRVEEMCSGYSPENIFNADETGVFYRALPDRTLAAKADGCKGGKVSKERLTVLFTCSMTGEKLKPFVVGKSVKPRCFKNVDTNTLPAYWNANKKAWMTIDLFNQYARELNTQMRRQGRKILLFLDNATCHPHIKLSHVTLKFFPANTTSVLQPLDQGAIRAFKARYRKRLLRSVIAKIDDASNASEVAKAVNVLDAVYWIGGAWQETKEETIRKCFRKGGFNVDTEESDVIEERDDELRTLIEEINAGSSETCTVEQYLNFDDDLPTEATYDGEWEEQIVQNFLADKESESREPEEIQDEAQNADSENIDPNDGSTLTYAEVLDMLQKLQNFAANRDTRYLAEVQNLKSLTERHIVQKKCSLKQSSLDCFFNKS